MEAWVGAGSPVQGLRDPMQTASPVFPQQESNSERWLPLSHDDPTGKGDEGEREGVGGARKHMGISLQG